MAFWNNGGSTKGNKVVPSGVTHFPGSNPQVHPGGSTKASPPIPQGPPSGTVSMASPAAPMTMSAVHVQGPGWPPPSTQRMATAHGISGNPLGQSVTYSQYIDPMAQIENREDSLRMEDLTEATEALKGWAKLRSAGAIGPFWCPGVDGAIDRGGTGHLQLDIVAPQGMSTSLGSTRSAKVQAHRALADALEQLGDGARVWLVFERPG